MADLLFRGRGADVGSRAPGWQVRACGLLLGVALAEVARALDLWSSAGVQLPTAHAAAALAGWVLAPSVAGALLWGALAVLVALLLGASYTPLVASLVPRFIRHDPPPAAGAVDAVVVFSGSMTTNGRVREQGLERLLSGMVEARQRRIPVLALSVLTDGAASSEADQRRLVGALAPDVTVRFVHGVHSTRDEALAFAAMARTHGWRRVLVVTSPLHSRRACAAVERAGVAVACRPAEGRTYAPERLDQPFNRKMAFQGVVYETLATGLYRMRGWM
ncbi:MAG: YdcF family protein [Gemmatimonadetes bacterium]|nr:YdcF family protein [Gemmatimonadota bacterium]